MRRLGLMLTFAAATALAQRGGIVTDAPAGALPAGGFASGFGLPQLSPIPTLQPLPAFFPGAVFRTGPAFGIRRSLGAGFFPYFSIGGYAAYPPAQNIVVVQAPPPPAAAPAPAPPKPAQPRIWEAPAAPSREGEHAGGEPKSFQIALKNGSTTAATAVWAEDDTLHWVDTNGVHWRAGLDMIDRDATRRLNQAQNLVLRLPAAAGPPRLPPQ